MTKPENPMTTIVDKLSDAEQKTVCSWSIERVINNALSEIALDTPDGGYSYDQLETVKPILKTLWNHAQDEIHNRKSTL